MESLSVVAVKQILDGKCDCAHIQSVKTSLCESEYGDDTETGSTSGKDI